MQTLTHIKLQGADPKIIAAARTEERKQWQGTIAIGLVFIAFSALRFWINEHGTGKGPEVFFWALVGSALITALIGYWVWTKVNKVVKPLPGDVWRSLALLPEGNWATGLHISETEIVSYETWNNRQTRWPLGGVTSVTFGAVSGGAFYGRRFQTVDFMINNEKVSFKVKKYQDLQRFLQQNGAQNNL